MTARMLAILLMLAGLAGCGGGGSAAGTPPGTAVTLQSIAITPATLTLGKGAIQGYTATGTYSDSSTQDITTSATWTSSATGVATVGASTGVVTTIAAGTTTLTASAGGKSVNVDITVTSTVAKQIVALAVSPDQVRVTPNSTKQLTATATYSDGSSADVTPNVTWSSGDASIATVSNTGLLTAGATAGSVSVSAAMGAATGKSHSSIDSVTLIGLGITPQTIYTGIAWDPGTWVSASLSNGTGQTPYSATFAITGCTPANAATYDSTTGMISANKIGTCAMTASVGTNAGTVTSSAATLTVSEPVLNTIAITPATATVGAGSTLQLAAIGTYNTGAKKDVTQLLMWSSNSAAATVATGNASAGLVSGVASGTATITAAALVPAGNPPVSSATAAITVPGTPPVAAAATLSGAAVTDNTIGISSLVPTVKATVYSNGYPDPNGNMQPGSIAVGCNWYLTYDPVAVMNIQHLNCSQSLVKFNLASIPAGKTIVNATLQLQTYSYGVGYVPRAWHVQALSNPNWSGSAATWNNTSSYYYYTAFSIANIAPPSPANQSYNLDVTNAVRNWYSGAWVNYGFVLGLDDMITWPYMISLDAFRFYGSEDAGGRGPKLVVNYQ
ncbi:MAG: Ig-like domain-containing protein [Nitrosomonadales bacterium]|nr:Ig-like domain-containing protein [Nitrosomonadales bacterium]